MIGVLLRTLLLLPIAGAVALGNWSALVRLGGWPRVGLIVAAVITFLLLRWQAGRRPAMAGLLALPHAAAIGLALAATVSFATELVPEPIAWQGVALPITILAIAAGATLAGLLRPRARWLGVLGLLLATSALFAADRQATPRLLLLPVIDDVLLAPSADASATLETEPERGSGRKAHRTAADDPVALARAILAGVFLLYVVLGYPIELTAELRRLDVSARPERPWLAAMDLVFSLAWFWLSLVVAAASGRGRTDDLHGDA
jgi:hypothetical protein